MKQGYALAQKRALLPRPIYERAIKADRSLVRFVKKGEDAQ
jgi:hypothetical protein